MNTPEPPGHILQLKFTVPADTCISHEEDALLFRLPGDILWHERLTIPEGSAAVQIKSSTPAPILPQLSGLALRYL